MGNGVPRAVGQGRAALRPGLEVPRVNGAGEIRQGFGSRAKGEPQAPGGWYWSGWRGVIFPGRGGIGALDFLITHYESFQTNRSEVVR
jgi:hypothetical protein